MAPFALILSLLWPLASAQRTYFEGFVRPADVSISARPGAVSESACGALCRQDSGPGACRAFRVYDKGRKEE